jgi:hypothetical protein
MSYRIGSDQSSRSDPKSIRFSGGGMHPNNKVSRAASTMAYRPDDDVRTMMRVEESAVKPLEEAQRINEGRSCEVSFANWLNDAKQHMTYHCIDSVGFILVGTIADINGHLVTIATTQEINLFSNWGSVCPRNRPWTLILPSKPPAVTLIGKMIPSHGSSCAIPLGQVSNPALIKISLLIAPEPGCFFYYL